MSPLWRVLADYDQAGTTELLDNYNVDQLVHNLQDCVCAEGYYMDDDHVCRSCRGIHFDCVSCANSETCTACGSDQYMLSPVENDYVTCQPKIEHCELPMYQQPQYLKAFDFDGDLKLVCERCKEGYFWKDPETGKHNGNCVPCRESMSHCL